MEFIELLYEFGGNLWQPDGRGRRAWEAEPDSLLAKPLRQLAGTDRRRQHTYSDPVFHMETNRTFIKRFPTV